MYAKGPGGKGEAGGTAEQAGASKTNNDNVVDADFDEVQNDKN
jgi:hypothetical protein